MYTFGIFVKNQVAAAVSLCLGPLLRFMKLSLLLWLCSVT